MKGPIYFHQISTPVGPLYITGTEVAILQISFFKPGTFENGRRPSVVLEAASQLKEYFDHQRQAFTVPLDLRGTSFQKKVWMELKPIEFGEVTTYKAIAEAVGSPGSVRAVGNANGRNPVAIIVPCHRVIGSAGQLTGYAGGLDRKRWLFLHEGGWGQQMQQLEMFSRSE